MSEETELATIDSDYRHFVRLKSVTNLFHITGFSSFWKSRECQRILFWLECHRIVKEFCFLSCSELCFC